MPGPAPRGTLGHGVAVPGRTGWLRHLSHRLHLALAGSEPQVAPANLVSLRYNDYMGLRWPFTTLNFVSFGGQGREARSKRNRVRSVMQLYRHFGDRALATSG